MKVIITPNKLQGTVKIPPSKSLLHRAIMASSLAQGKSVITNVSYSKDIEATIKAMASFGAKINTFEDRIEIEGCYPKRINDVIDANESGSTLRFIIPLALLEDKPVTFVGHGKLPKRPLDPYFDIFRRAGIKYEKGEDNLPLKIEGKLKASMYLIQGDVSSQFITGLLFTLPLLEGKSELYITTEMESTSYVDLTLDILKKYGIEVENNHYHNFDVIGKQSYKAHDYEVEGDYSQAAFFLVANMLGADIKVDGLKKDSKQGDKKILEDIKAFNGEIIYDNNLVSCKTDQIYANQISFSNSPDLGPILSVLAALAKGRTEFIHAERLRLKECDRISCVVEELTKLGANVTETDDGMIFEGVNSFKGGVVDSHNDHRLAMAFAMASLKCEGEITILNAECVAKSYPDFFKVFESLGGKVRYED